MMFSPKNIYTYTSEQHRNKYPDSISCRMVIFYDEPPKSRRSPKKLTNFPAQPSIHIQPHTVAHGPEDLAPLCQGTQTLGKVNPPSEQTTIDSGGDLNILNVGYCEIG